MKKKYLFQEKVWLYPTVTNKYGLEQNGWHFITLPKKIAQEIRQKFSQKKKRGWGSIRVKISIGKTKWITSIFPDKRSESYLLPIKSQVRKVEKIYPDSKININLEII